MYTKAMLCRYAETIEDEQERQTFTEVVATIPFDKRGFCYGGAPEKAFSGTSVYHFCKDFEKRYFQFLSIDDFPRLQPASANEN